MATVPAPRPPVKTIRRPLALVGARDGTQAALVSMRDELRRLRRAVRRLQTRPVQIILAGALPAGAVPAPPDVPADDTATEPLPSDRGRPASPIPFDILNVLREVGRPLTTTRL